MGKKISAIISTYNSEKFIKGRLDNLINGTLFSKTEIIIVNSASEENEDQIIKSYLAKYDNIKYLKTPKRETLYASWNRAIRVASGEYLINANTDDQSRVDAFEIMANTLDHNLKTALVYSDYYVTKLPNEIFNGRPIKPHWKPVRLPDYSRDRLMRDYFCGPLIMWRKDIHEKLGYFDESYTYAGDYEFCLRISEYYPILRIPKFLCLHYYNKKGLYLKNKDTLKEETRAIKKFI